MSKVVFLIGHSTGLGLEAAKQLLIEYPDYRVYASAPDTSPMGELEALGAKLLTIDVTNTQSVESAFNQVLDAEGRIDVVHFNAGLNVSKPVELASEEEAQLVFDINLLGLGRVIRTVSPHFRKHRSGRLVVTGSVISHFSSAGYGWYASTKHALYGLVTAYRQEVMDLGIEVVLIEPGQINTGFDQAAVGRLRESDIPEDYKPLVRQWIAFTLDRLEGCPTGEKTAKYMVEAITTKKPKHIYKTSADAYWVPMVTRWLGPKRADKFVRANLSKNDPEHQR